ncbi:uroporphyrinogen-III synthase [Sulfitobacter sp. HNIBRBA2951]|uniref:uroporphyrinogen-III synthase n=1 Tax=Sulfitobacter aquimarinus TaxID=3158557 RepID=UPI0032DFEF8A
MTPTTLLLTRPRPSAQAFVDALNVAALAKVDVVIAPLMEIVRYGDAPDIGPSQQVIFTSANAVAFAPDGQGRAAFCVGAQTTRLAKQRGWTAQQMGDTAQQLIAAIQAHPLTGDLIHLGGVHTRGDIAQTLTQAGINTTHTPIYDQILLPLDSQGQAALQRPSIVPVFSPRSAVQLAAQTAGALHHAHIIALSEAVAAPLRGESCADLTVLPKPQAIYMVKEVEKQCLTLGLP